LALASAAFFSVAILAASSAALASAAFLS